MNIKLFTLLLVIFLIGVGGVIYFRFSNNKITFPSDQIQVVTSFYPLYYFTSEIGQPVVNVVNLTPAGAEPHDWEPSTQDVAVIENSKLLILNGAGFEPWAEKIVPELSDQVKIVSVADHLANLSLEEESQTQHDPHIWLDPVLAQEEVKLITSGLMAIDPGHAQDYQRNSQDLLRRLDQLDQEFRTGLSRCKHQNIVNSHAAFGYLADRYGLQQISLTGISPDQEPSPQQLADIARLTKELGIKYIFFETLVSPRLAETLAAEAGAQTLSFDPLEGLSANDQTAGQNYFTVQRKNLQSLQVALECI